MSTHLIRHRREAGASEVMARSAGGTFSEDFEHQEIKPISIVEQLSYLTAC